MRHNVTLTRSGHSRGGLLENTTRVRIECGNRRVWNIEIACGVLPLVGGIKGLSKNGLAYVIHHRAYLLPIEQTVTLDPGVGNP